MRFDDSHFDGFIFWLKDEFCEVSDNLPDPDIIAQEIVGNLGDSKRAI